MNRNFPNGYVIPAVTERPHKKPSLDGSFCWQSSEAIQRIRDGFESGPLDQALALYLTLTDYARENDSEEFVIRRRDLAARSGICLRRVSEIIGKLKDLRLLDWCPTPGAFPNEQGPNRYFLLSVNQPPDASDALPHAPDATPIAND